jgi:hypothetical protein
LCLPVRVKLIEILQELNSAGIPIEIPNGKVKNIK